MLMPTAGDLRTRLALRTWEDVPSGFSGVVPQYGPSEYRWGKVAPVGGAVYWGAKQIEAAVTHRITLRYHATVSSRHVVEAEGLRYRVCRITHSTGAKRWTWLECELLGGI